MIHPPLTAQHPIRKTPLSESKASFLKIKKEEKENKKHSQTNQIQMVDHKCITAYSFHVGS